MKPWSATALLAAASCAAPGTPPATPHLAAAEQAASWLRHSAVAEQGVLRWPAVPAAEATLVDNLYSGGAAVVLFFLELHHATGDPRALNTARRGAHGLLRGLVAARARGDAGLYTGVAGIACALQQAFEATGDRALDDGVCLALDWLEQRARPVAQGVEWSPVTDVISGTAGVGFFLLWIAERRDEPRWLDLARRAGRRLATLGQPDGVGAKWAMRADYPRMMPNFSHGTAGVCAFLAHLSARTGDPSFLETALAGGEYLLSIADTRGLIFHHEPDGEDLFYLGWCHGPAGTSRLFAALYDTTGDPKWQRAAVAPIDVLTSSGLPGARLPGLWNNVGPCCGTAGVGEYLLRWRDGSEWQSFCESIARDQLERSTVQDGRRSWQHAEHRVRPDLLLAQTGWAQGAAGIGLWLLHLDGALRGRAPMVVLPDDL